MTIQALTTLICSGRVLRGEESVCFALNCSAEIDARPERVDLTARVPNMFLGHTKHYWLFLSSCSESP